MFPFTGLIRCGECGLMVTAEEKHQVMCDHCRFKFAYRRQDSCPRCQTPLAKMANPLFLHYIYYHCSKSMRPRCLQKSISSTELDRQIDVFLGRIQISERFKEWAIKYLHELHEKEITARNHIIQAQQKTYQECLRQIDNLVKLKTSHRNVDGSQLSDDEYSRQRVELLKEKASLEELLQDVGHQVGQWLKLTEETFEFACTARENFATGDSTTKKAILAAIGSNLTLRDKKLCIEAKKPFFLMQKSLPHVKDRVGAFEPEKAGLSQGRKEQPVSHRPIRCPRGHDVRTYGPKMQELVESIYHFFRDGTN